MKIMEIFTNNIDTDLKSKAIKRDNIGDIEINFYLEKAVSSCILMK
jgi:hypothetical protein